jgi:hypothetical protein
MQYVLAAAVVAGLSLIYGRFWLRRRRGAPLRREIRARGITFRSHLDRVTVMEPGWLQPDSDFGAPISSPVELIVRGGAFEVSSSLWLGRVVMGLEYCFRACETSVELNRVVPRIYGMDDTLPRIVVRGWQAGRKVQLTIGQKNDPLEIWDALTASGAVPSPAWVTRAGGT